MTYPAQLLITRSWYLSGIVGRNLETVTGDQITDGLMLLNALLDFKQVQLDLIPYWTYDTSKTTIPGQENYFYENTVAIESVTFNIDVVRYATDYTTRSVYYGAGRVDNVETLPFNWYFNRELGGGNLALYFIPDGHYPLKVMCKKGLTNVILTTELTTIYDTSYIEYLRYALAQYMCLEYGIGFAPEKLQKLKEMEYQLIDVSPPDLSMRKVSILCKGTGIQWADINLGKGWRPL